VKAGEALGFWSYGSNSAGGSGGRKFSSVVQGQSQAWRGSGAKLPEAEATLQIVHVEKVFCALHVVSKCANYCSTKVCIKCRSTNILRVSNQAQGKQDRVVGLRLELYRYYDIAKYASTSLGLLHT